MIVTVRTIHLTVLCLPTKRCQDEIMPKRRATFYGCRPYGSGAVWIEGLVLACSTAEREL